ncbi:MAG: hydroxymethylbilane synthase [Nitrososphaerales archaeon]
MKIRIATRESKLSVKQVEVVLEALKNFSLDCELIFVKTKGDIYQDLPPAKIGSKGIFEKEVNLALLNGLADIAVHSLKDIPTEVGEGLELIATMKRDSPFDCLISKKGEKLLELPEKAKVGTSSIRRKLALKSLRDDLEVIDLRGNLDTRIRKLEEGYYDAILVAEAGVNRLGLRNKIAQVFNEYQITPAPCQGIIGIYSREDDKEIKKIFKEISDKSSYLEATIERRIVKEVGGGCYSALGVYSKVNGGSIRIVSSLYFPNKENNRTVEEYGSLEDLDSILPKVVKGLKSI